MHHNFVFWNFFGKIPERAGVAQLVERQPSKLNVASSSLVSRSKFFEVFGFNNSSPSSSGVERILGKDEVTSSNLVLGSTKNFIKAYN
jgi:hypothetical protein